MSQPAGTVRRYVADNLIIESGGDQFGVPGPHVVVLASDYDLLAAQAAALAEALKKQIELRLLYQYPLVKDRKTLALRIPEYQQAQALLDAQRRTT